MKPDLSLSSHPSSITHIYKKGEVLFHQDTSNSGVFCLCDGMVKVFSTDKDGGEVILRVAGPGDLVGHGCLTGHKIHINSAVAIEDTKCSFIDTSVLNDLLNQNPSLMLSVLNMVQGELNEAQNRNVHLVKCNVRQRLATYFTHMAAQFGEHNIHGTKINIRLSREEIASYIGTAHETAIRFISEFKALGLIKEEEKFFYVLDQSEMARLSGK